MRVLIDTCVVVDILTNRTPFCEDAKRVFQYAIDEEIDAFITAKSIADIYYLVHKYTHSDELSRNAIRNLLKIVDVIDTTSSDCIGALDSNIKDYEDAIVVESSIKNNMNCIVTRNLKDFKKAKITVLDPQELLRKITLKK